MPISPASIGGHAGGTAPFRGDPLFSRDFVRAMVMGAGGLLGLALMGALLRSLGVIGETEPVLPVTGERISGCTTC